MNTNFRLFSLLLELDARIELFTNISLRLGEQITLNSSADSLVPDSLCKLEWLLGDSVGNNTFGASGFSLKLLSRWEFF